MFSSPNWINCGERFQKLIECLLISAYLGSSRTDFFKKNIDQISIFKQISLTYFFNLYGKKYRLLRLQYFSYSQNYLTSRQKDRKPSKGLEKSLNKIFYRLIVCLWILLHFGNAKTTFLVSSKANLASLTQWINIVNSRLRKAT